MKTRVYRITDASAADARKMLDECAQILKDGGLVAFPTETVYGLGALAKDSRAVNSIFHAKGRPQDNPLIVHITGIDDLPGLVSEIPPAATVLAARFWPGPLTLVMKAGHAVAKQVSAGLNTVGVRVPDHPVALELIRRAGPLAAPSANVSGRPSPTTAQHVLADLDGRIHAVVDAGPTGVGLESTVLDISSDTPVILRPGGVTLESLSEVLPGVSSWTGHVERPRSPGQKYMHYAPRAKMLLVKGDDPSRIAHRVGALTERLLTQGKRVGVLATAENAALFSAVFSESVESGRLVVLVAGSRDRADEIASGLFSRLREFDALGVDTIIAEGVNQTDIGVAIMDRLERAATTVIDANKPALRVLFVCTGNTCRSPMAEALFRKMAESRGLNIEFISAGTGATKGEPAAEHARQVARERGASLDGHQSQPLTTEIVRDADLILTMTRSHSQEVLHRFPDASGKVHTLAEHTGEAGLDVDDPIGCGLDTYRLTADQLEAMAHVFFRRLKEKGVPGANETTD